MAGENACRLFRQHECAALAGLYDAAMTWQMPEWAASYGYCFRSPLFSSAHMLIAESFTADGITMPITFRLLCVLMAHAARGIGWAIYLLLARIE